MKMIDQEVDGLGDYDEDGHQVDIDGVELELDDQIDDEIGDQEMFNQQIMQEQQNRDAHRRGQSHGEQHDSTIINSSQNTSLEQNFMHNQE